MLKYKCRIKPSCILPPDLIYSFYSKEPECLVESREWVNKNGLIIIFTAGLAEGHEAVWLDPDSNIYIGWDKYPPKASILRWLSKFDPKKSLEAHKDKWSTKKVFEVYSTFEITF